MQGKPHVAIHLDDIILTGATKAQHLGRLEKAGLRIKRKKCTFLADEVVHLGHRIHQHRIHQHGLCPVQDKVEAILKARSPENIQELQAFLGLLNYYGRFMYKLSTVLAHLHNLLFKGQKWLWEPPQQRSFQRAKEFLLSAEVLAHYDPNKPILLQCNASNYGLGSHLGDVAPKHADKEHDKYQHLP